MFCGGCKTFITEAQKQEVRNAFNNARHYETECSGCHCVIVVLGKNESGTEQFRFPLIFSEKYINDEGVSLKPY